MSLNARNTTGSTVVRKRWCFWINPSQTPLKEGYVPSVIVEGEPGHRPLIGDGSPVATPWYWGTTLRQAEEVAATENAKRGLSMAEVDDIIVSSMQASYRGQTMNQDQLPAPEELRT